MASTDLRGKIQTVLGAISPEALGITLPHEHLISDFRMWCREPEEASERGMVNHPVTVDILWWLRYHPFQNRDDFLYTDEETAIDEVLIYKSVGGNSIVELTAIGIGRDPLALARISRITGVNIIMGSGYYVEGSYPTRVNMDARTEEQIAEDFVKEIMEGVGNTGVQAGLIGELGCSWPLTDNEKKVLRAGARAQKITGAFINIHPGHNEDAPMECIQVVDEAGADLTRTVMSHIDRCVRESKNRIELAKTGCYLEYDLFGREGYYPPHMRVLDVPNDAQRINELKDLADRGYQNQLLISQDNAQKQNLCRYGGWGYGHILRDAVPVMKIKGLSKELIDAMLIENPKRLLTII